MKKNIFYFIIKIIFIICFQIVFQVNTCHSKSLLLGAKTHSPSKFILLNGVAATPEAFQEIVSVFGNTSGRKTAVGVGFIISYLAVLPEEAATQLRKYLDLSAKFDLPIIVQLDGEQWWQNRPDLWNWWDKNKPGYNPENKKNVEWTDWTSDSAVKIGWRNWGRQLRVGPMPNLMSPLYRKACHIEMKKLVSIVMNWWQLLPKDKKYLLVGIKVGWESAIGVNNWYYPNGNDLLGQPEKNDPKYGLKVDSLPGRGVKAIGYAAVSTLGLSASGKLTEKELTEVVRLHLKDLSKACADLGVPRERLFTHCGGWSHLETLHSAALNSYSCPGWSFYKYAYDPQKETTTMKALKQSNAPYWGAVEWLYDEKAKEGNTEKAWASALKKTLAITKIKYLCIYNWGGIKNNHSAIEAIRSISGNS
ncbi:MAG TPA: hypothetical protein VGP43_06065 [Chitinophagaceae bacterium]|nr:hypothetical protein [Chitinophagaceae bacterium]